MFHTKKIVIIKYSFSIALSVEEYFNPFFSLREFKPRKRLHTDLFFHQALFHLSAIYFLFTSLWFVWFVWELRDSLEPLWAVWVTSL